MGRVLVNADNLLNPRNLTLAFVVGWNGLTGEMSRLRHRLKRFRQM